MQNKYLIIIIVVLSIIAIVSSPNKEETAYFNDDLVNVTVKDVDSNEETNLDLEEYVIGVVAGEMPASFEIEALKAQAIAARSYALSKIETSTESYDLVTDITNQVYITTEDMQEKWGEDYDFYYDKIKNAVAATKNLVMEYEGDVISAYYFAMSNGATEDVSLVFGEARDYLKSVDSSWDESVKNFSVTTTFTKEEFCSKLSIDCSNITIGAIDRSSTNRVNTIVINDKEFKGTTLRTLLGLRSTDFTIDIADDIKITTKGYGHGVGMSQYGANEMAKNGASYEEILNHYYKDIDIVESQTFRGHVFADHVKSILHIIRRNKTHQSAELVIEVLFDEIVLTDRLATRSREAKDCIGAVSVQTIKQLDSVIHLVVRLRNLRSHTEIAVIAVSRSCRVNDHKQRDRIVSLCISGSGIVILSHNGASIHPLCDIVNVLRIVTYMENVANQTSVVGCYSACIGFSGRNRRSGNFTRRSRIERLAISVRYFHIGLYAIPHQQHYVSSRSRSVTKVTNPDTNVVFRRRAQNVINKVCTKAILDTVRIAEVLEESLSLTGLIQDHGVYLTTLYMDRNKDIEPGNRKRNILAFRPVRIVLEVDYDVRERIFVRFIENQHRKAPPF